MSFLDKEFKFERQENIEELVESLGEGFEKILNNPLSLKFTQDGDTYTLITTTDDSTSELTFTPSVAFEEKFGDLECKTAFTIDGDEVHSCQNFGDDLIIVYMRIFDGDEMVETIKSSKWEGEAKKYFKA